MKNSIKLHLGSGTNLIKGWENLDLEPRKGAILCDLSKPLPYKTDSVDKIFTEHVIEHLEKKDGTIGVLQTKKFYFPLHSLIWIMRQLVLFISLI